MPVQNKLALLAALAVGSSFTNALPGSYGSHGPKPNSCGEQLYPNIAETSHASPQAVKLFHDYFTAKSLADPDDFLATWNPREAEYLDSTLGLTIAANRSQLVAIQEAQSSNGTIPAGRSYPLRILGDTVGGAVVYFVDTVELFGAEIRALSSFDFLDGKIRRQLDNWDGRGNAGKMIFGSDPQYPYSLGLNGIPELAAPVMKRVARTVQKALSAGNATAVASLFSVDGVFEDLTLRARIDGRIAIAAYLERTLPQLPYGAGTNVTHVLGNSVGGGYEWRPTGDTVRYGMTALELDCSGNITRFTAVWDGDRVTRSLIQGLAKLAPTP